MQARKPWFSPGIVLVQFTIFYLVRIAVDGAFDHRGPRLEDFVIAATYGLVMGSLPIQWAIKVTNGAIERRFGCRSKKHLE